MRTSTVVLVLCLYNICCLTECSRCQLPKINEETDFTNFTGVWYENIHPKEEVYNVVSCQLFIYHEEENGGFSVQIGLQGASDFGYENYGDIQQNFERIGPSTFRPKHESGIEKAKYKIAQHDPAVEAYKIETYMNTRKFLAFVSIAKNEAYVIMLRCDLLGSKEVHVATPKLVPTAETLRDINKKLKEIGDGWDKVELQIAKCFR